MSQSVPDFARIYETYHGRVRAYAAKLIGRDEADDVAQEVFVKIHRSLETLEDPEKLAAWVYAITLNTVRDAARKRASRAELPAAARAGGDDHAEADDPLGHLPDTKSRSPEERAMRNEMVACFLDYVMRLPQSYYEVYSLAEFEELSNAKIAQRLCLSLQTVKIRLHRARAELYAQFRHNCRCFYTERGELMGGPKED